MLECGKTAKDALHMNYVLGSLLGLLAVSSWNPINIYSVQNTVFWVVILSILENA